jgi:hypothetical protein
MKKNSLFGFIAFLLLYSCNQQENKHVKREKSELVVAEQPNLPNRTDSLIGLWRLTAITYNDINTTKNNTLSKTKIARQICGKDEIILIEFLPNYGLKINDSLIGSWTPVNGGFEIVLSGEVPNSLGYPIFLNSRYNIGISSRSRNLTTNLSCEGKTKHEVHYTLIKPVQKAHSTHSQQL